MNLKLFRENIVYSSDTLPKPIVNNPLLRYYKGIQLAEKLVQKQKDFSKPVEDCILELPEITEKYVELFEHSSISRSDILVYKDYSIELLNLMSDPTTNTTKTFPTLLTVAKLINHIKKTGETVIILTPSSGNKATAFRAAVEKAIEKKLVAAEKLRTITLIPRESVSKFRASKLYNDKKLNKLNPVFIYSGDESDDVKKIAQEFYKKNYQSLKEKKVFLFYSLHIDNYRVADTLRAFFDYESSFDRGNNFTNSWHVHSVSSAFGLIGYNLGCQVLCEQKLLSEQDLPGYFMVQHLATPDMIIYLNQNNFDYDNFPEYKYDNNTGLFTQSALPYFPYYTYDKNELLDSTFYTHKPSTSVTMNDLIMKYGGGGIIVSLAECINRYPILVKLLRDININIPKDIRKIREWSLVMAYTGILNAIDRGLIPCGKNLIIHASGFYTDENVQYLSNHNLISIQRDNAIDKIEHEIYKFI